MFIGSAIVLGAMLVLAASTLLALGMARAARLNYPPEGWQP